MDAIAAAPDDDAPRLVYADWLSGPGDPRGEFIQLDCQLAAAPDDPRRRALKIAHNKLLKEHGERWSASVLAVLPQAPGFHEVEHRRGMIEFAKITIADLPHLDALFAVAPMLRELAIVPGELGPGPTLGGARFAKPRLRGALLAPAFSRLRSLTLALQGGGNELAIEVANAATLSSLRRLTLVGSIWGEIATWYAAPPGELIIDDRGAEALAASMHLAQVKELHLGGNRVGARGLAAIARGAWRLEQLDLSENELDMSELGNTVGKVFSLPALANLETLGLVYTRISKSLKQLFGGPHLAKLRELDIERCGVGAKGAEQLCKVIDLPSLRRLRIDRNSLADAGAMALASCQGLAKLTKLEAGHNLMGKKGGTAIATSPVFANLQQLNLYEPRWKPEMREVFAASPTLAKTKIYLSGTLVGRAAKTKPKAPKVSRLRDT